MGKWFEDSGNINGTADVRQAVWTALEQVGGHSGDGQAACAP
jgi:hypothetical protein